MVAQIAIPAGACASVAEAEAALAACLGYFRRVEPSSPAVLLIGQAQRLIGKSLIEVIQIMFPEHVDKAMLEIGDDTKYQLPLERLGGDGYDSGSSGYDDDSSSSDDESSSYDDNSSYDEETTSEDGESEESGDAEAEVSEDADSSAEEEQPEAEPAPREPAAAPRMPVIIVASRAEAIARMKSIAAFYRHAEPSNPVPLLMDKACGLAQQDFLSLLSDILPEVGIRQSSDE